MAARKEAVGSDFDAVQLFTQTSQSQSTRRSYAQSVKHFEAHGGRIGARPKVVAKYLADFAGHLAVATLEHRLIAIHRAHVDLGLNSPVRDRLVQKTMQGIRRSVGRIQGQAQALVNDDMLELLVAAGRQKLCGQPATRRCC